jgi:hypothetical protein
MARYLTSIYDKKRKLEVYNINDRGDRELNSHLGGDKTSLNVSEADVLVKLKEYKDYSSLPDQNGLTFDELVEEIGYLGHTGLESVVNSLIGKKLINVEYA